MTNQYGDDSGDGRANQPSAASFEGQFIPLAQSELVNVESYINYSAQKNGFDTQAALKDLHDLANSGDANAAVLAEELERMDPLTRRPRTASWVGCLLLGLLFLGISAAVWWLSVFTLAGQQYEDEVYTHFAAYVKSVPLLESILGLFTMSVFTIGLCCALGVLAFVIAALRKRWWLLFQVLVYAAVSYGVGRLLKLLLPRPFIINGESMRGNSAPSGHTVLAVTAAIVLLCVVPRVWRAFSAVLGCAFAVLVGCSVIDGRWHRPADVLMAIFLAGGFALLMLSVTRASGMDKPGTRYSSASVQIVATIMITAGILGSVYGVFLIWQMIPGLQNGALWTFYGAHVSAVVFVASAAAIVFGTLLAMRQVTASPLSKIGLLGAPPTPPEKL